MHLRITIIECQIGEPIPPQPTREEEERDKDDQYERALWTSEAARACRCDLLWSPCEGVLAGGICDELTTDEYEEEAWAMGVEA
jgi:hypothetical protein